MFKTDAEFYGPVMGCRILASCEAPPFKVASATFFFFVVVVFNIK